MQDTEARRLLARAREAREKAYAPFSQFKVGAAILLADGRTFTGCNVECSSYGLTLCAERTAIACSVVEGGGEVVAVAIIADTERPCPPCGACRQWIMEWGPHAQVVMSNLRGDIEETTIGALLPGAFTAGFFKAQPPGRS